MVQLKTVSKLINANQAEKMLQHFEKYKLIKISSKGIQFGFITESLQELVRKEWLISNAVASDYPSFVYTGLKTPESLKTALEDIKNLVSTAPFSLVEVDCTCNKKEDKVLPDTTNAVELVSNQFRKQSGTILRTQTFCAPTNATEIFHKKQRDRKNWWRKFAALPGRFVTSNVSKKENDKSAVSEIQAEFPWGLETIETITYIPDISARDNIFAELNTTKRKRFTGVVSCEALLENIAFTYLCDSYGKLNGNSDRDMLKFSKKLAPFKVSFAGTGSDKEMTKSLEELSLLLAKQIRKLGISVLFLPDAFTTSVEQQVLRNDALGVPYTIVLNEKTLQVGTLALRSRDTMLQEDSHVSLITEYLGKIFN